MQPYILMATPAYGGSVVIDYARSAMAMVKHAMEQKIQLATMMTTSGFVSRSRNSAASAVIHNKQFTHLLTVDADMGWPAEALSRLLAKDKDIVGCTYPRRTMPNGNTPSFIAGLRPLDAISEDGFVKAKYVGCGFMLVKRHVLEKMAAFYPERRYADETQEKPMFDLFPSGRSKPFADDTRGHPQVEVTDDVGFAILAEEAGFDVWADVRSILTHSGPITFNAGSLESWMKVEQAKPSP